MAKILWHMTSTTHARYVEISNEMLDAAKAQDTMRYKQAEDQFRALPGRPKGIHLDLDLVVPKITDLPTRIITTGSTH